MENKLNITNWIKTNLIKNKKNLIFSICGLALTTALTAIVGTEFKTFRDYEPFFYVNERTNENPTGTVTKIEHFSDYSKNLKGTVGGDTAIYCLEGAEPGPSILILGGTHPNEPSGQLTATVLLENLKVEKGTVYIVTETNRSAFTHSYPQEGSPFYYTINAQHGSRTFKFGSRATNTNDQWPNPDIYTNAYYGSKLSTSETRNLNRAYPGREDGSYTEQVAYAITNFIHQKDVAITIDLHEASPEYQTINAAITHANDSEHLGGWIANALSKKVFENEAYGGSSEDALGMDVAGSNLRGLTHIELGDHTNTLAMIFETSNAAQGKYRGAFTEGTILYESGNDPYYEYVATLEDGNGKTVNGSLYARPTTIEERVARHAACIAEAINSYNTKIFGLERSGSEGSYSYTTEFNTDNAEKCFHIDEYDSSVKIDFRDTRYATNAELIAARQSQGYFLVDFSSIYDNSEINVHYPASTMKKVSTSVYQALFNYSIGTFLY